MNLDQAQIKGTLYDLKDRYKWTGTKAEWDALDKSTLPQDAEVIVNITDDYDESTPGITIDTLTTMEQVNAETDVSKPVGAGAVKELNNSLSNLNFITRANVGTNGLEITIPDNAKFIVIDAVVRKGQIGFTRIFPTSMFSLDTPKIQDVFPLIYTPTIFCTNRFTILKNNVKYLLNYTQWAASDTYQSDGYVDVYWM